MEPLYPYVTDCKPTTKERFSKAWRFASGERWITLNGGSGDDGHGGTPVKVDDSGNIVDGPKGLADKGVKNLNDFKKGEEGKGSKPAPKDQEHKSPESKSRPSLAEATSDLSAHLKSERARNAEIRSKRAWDSKGWNVVPSPRGFSVEHGQTRNLSDRVWETYEEAQKWADEANVAQQKQEEEWKKQAAERRKLRPRPLSETHTMLQTGDDLKPWAS